MKIIETKNYKEMSKKACEILIENIKEADYHDPAISRVEMHVESKGEKPLILGCSLSFLNDGKGERIGDILVFQDLTAIKRMELIPNYLKKPNQT